MKIIRAVKASLLLFLKIKREQFDYWKKKRKDKKRERLIMRFRVKELRMLERDAEERREIARVFNNRYCVGERYDRSSNKLIPGTANEGSLWNEMKEGFRWMCPTCNKIHAPLSNCWSKGLIYPKCCSSPLGPKHGSMSYYIAAAKRPLGWCGPDGLYLKMLRAGIQPCSDFTEWQNVSHGPNT